MIAVISLLVVNVLVMSILQYRQMKKIKVLTKKLETSKKNFEEFTTSYRGDKKDIFSQFGNIIKLFEKVNKTISLNRKNFDDFARDVDRDLDNLFNLTKAMGDSMIEGTKLHNDLVDMTYESFKDIFCDMNDCQCQDCAFYEKCIAFEEHYIEQDSIRERDVLDDECSPVQTASNPNIIKSGVIVVGPKGQKFTIDSTDDPKKIEQLKKAMIASGVPEHLANDAVKYILATLKTHLNTPQKREIKSEKKPDKNRMIKPDSKIVKSLEKLFKEDV